MTMNNVKKKSETPNMVIKKVSAQGKQDIVVVFI